MGNNKYSTVKQHARYEWNSIDSTGTISILSAPRDLIYSSSLNKIHARKYYCSINCNNGQQWNTETENARVRWFTLANFVNTRAVWLTKFVNTSLVSRVASYSSYFSRSLSTTSVTWLDKWNTFVYFYHFLFFSQFSWQFYYFIRFEK